MEEYIKNVIYKNKQEKYKKLKNLNNRIKKIPRQKKPFLIEFMGSARSGKSTSIEMISDILRKNGLKVMVIDEEYIDLTKSINQDRNKKNNINSLEYTNNIIEQKIMIYDNLINAKEDVIIFDRGINDEFIWLKIFDHEKDKRKLYDEKLNNRMTDELIIITCLPEVSIERKYNNSLSILSSKWTNIETMNNYIKALDTSLEYLKKHTKNVFRIDSTTQKKQDVALKICEDIVKKMDC